MSPSRLSKCSSVRSCSRPSFFTCLGYQMMITDKRPQLSFAELLRAVFQVRVGWLTAPKFQEARPARPELRSAKSGRPGSFETDGSNNTCSDLQKLESPRSRVCFPGGVRKLTKGHSAAHMKVKIVSDQHLEF